MKFLKINAKVLLILCLFSGILFLNTGCGGKKTNTDDNKGSEVDNNGKTNIDKDNNTTNDDNNNKNTNQNNGISLDDKTDYSVWVANTTINTNKSERSYKVIWGDTLWLISTAWEVPYQEIATFNRISNPDLIYVDQIIYNPTFK